MLVAAPVENLLFYCLVQVRIVFDVARDKVSDAHSYVQDEHPGEPVFPRQ